MRGDPTERRLKPHTIWKAWKICSKIHPSIKTLTRITIALGIEYTDESESKSSPNTHTHIDGSHHITHTYTYLEFHNILETCATAWEYTHIKYQNTQIWNPLMFIKQIADQKLESHSHIHTHMKENSHIFISDFFFRTKSDSFKMILNLKENCVKE